MIRQLLIAISSVVVAACQASAGAQVEAKSSGQVDANADAQLSGTNEESPTRALSPRVGADGSSENVNSTTSVPDAMLGARAGLRLSGTFKATCKCLSVAVGNPTDAWFVWEGPVTRTNPATQLVIGLSSEGVACPEAAADSLGASYHGYEVAGSDVIVDVETARLGRPIAQGAVIPRPPSGGHVVVRSVERKSPYGKSPDGNSQSCTVWTAP